MADKGSTQRQQKGKFKKNGQNQQDQEEKQRQKGQEKWPVDEIETES
jgi:hypothetical protein